MSEKNATSPQRRYFITFGSKVIAVLVGGALVPTTEVLARTGVTGISGEIPKLPEGDRQAKALGYHEDASKVDPTQYRRKDAQLCANCQLFSGAPGDEWGPCAIFSYRTHPKLNTPYVVNAGGWCLSWGPRAS
jgi:hypothetical protein